MKNTKNIVSAVFVFVFVILGCRADEPKFYKGKEIKYATAVQMVERINNYDTWGYEKVLVDVSVATKGVKINLPNKELKFAVDMGFSNFGKRNKLPDPSYIICSYSDSEEPKVLQIKALNKNEMISIIGRFNKQKTFKDPVIEDCEIDLENAFDKEKSQ